jgi:CheY-like chemotaxis protein
MIARRSTSQRPAATAHHEAGHAVVGWVLDPQIRPRVITIVSDGDTLGKVSRRRSVARAPKASQVTDQIATNRRFDAQILLAEDNRVNQKGAISMLTGLGCRVTLAQNGREAVELAEQLRFPVILMDCQMPEMDGFEAARLIRSGLGDEPVIIALTANSLHGDRERCIQAGMNDYLAKPFQRSDLVRLLDRYLPIVESAVTDAESEITATP